jgi:glutathione-regulated potassium-efflux system ancillary protein KefC
MIEAARTFGYRVFYGDATRLDLLRTAGAATAASWWWPWTTWSSRWIVDLAREHFPQSGAGGPRARRDALERLRDRGVTRVQREVFESSLVSAALCAGTDGPDA